MLMLKLKLFVAAAVLAPATAFAFHVNGCCGDWWCCLKHLGCC
jgi:hypothetical protein